MVASYWNLFKFFFRFRIGRIETCLTIHLRLKSIFSNAQEGELSTDFSVFQFPNNEFNCLIQLAFNLIRNNFNNADS